MAKPIANPIEKQVSPKAEIAKKSSTVSIWHPSFPFQSGGTIMLLLLRGANHLPFYGSTLIPMVLHSPFALQETDVLNT